MKAVGVHNSLPVTDASALEDVEIANIDVVPVDCAGIDFLAAISDAEAVPPMLVVVAESTNVPPVLTDRVPVPMVVCVPMPLSDAVTGEPLANTVVTLRSEAAHVAPTARVGRGCVIGPFAVIGPDVVLGNKVRVGASAVIDGHTTAP